jgi:hypothetical protein
LGHIGGNIWIIGFSSLSSFHSFNSQTTLADEFLKSIPERTCRPAGRQDPGDAERNGRRRREKIEKVGESAARKIARKFGMNLKKAKKKAKRAESGGQADTKKAKKLAKILAAKAAKKAKVPAAPGEKAPKIKKKDLTLAVDGQA